MLHRRRRPSHRRVPATTTTSIAPTTSSIATTTTTSTTTSTTSATTAAATRQVLPPATVPSKVDECTQQLTFEADGNAGPISCANGDLNVLAWEHFASGNPLVMSLGPYATPTQVQAALCADMQASTIPIETSTYNISALYYGWSFAIDPTSGGCSTPATPTASPAAVPAQVDPWAVVSEYYGDITSRDFPDAWNLISATMQARLGGYDQWIAGYNGTGAQDVTELNESGEQVDYDLESINPDGTIQRYSCFAIVEDGQLQSVTQNQYA